MQPRLLPLATKQRTKMFQGRLLAPHRAGWRAGGHNAKYSRIGPDPERKHEQRNRGEAWASCQHAQAVTHVLPERVQVTSFARDPLLDVVTRMNSHHGPKIRPALFGYLSRIRSKLSTADISDRITLSPTCKPCRTSIVVTELRPSFTLTRTASAPSLTILNRPMVLSA